MLLVSFAHDSYLLSYELRGTSYRYIITIQLDWLYNSMGQNNDKRQML